MQRVGNRHRAYTIQWNTYSKHELDYIRTWAKQRCTYWIIAHRICDGVPAADVYLRFGNTVSMTVVSEIARNGNVSTSTVSFKNMLSKYIDNSQFTDIENSEMAKSTKAKTTMAKHAEIATLLDSKGKCGTVVWCNHEHINDSYQDLLGYLASRDDIIVSRDDDIGVYQLIRDEISTRRRSIKAIVLIPKENAKLDFDYFRFLNEMRSGYILDSKYRLMFPPMNVMVISRAFVKKLPGIRSHDDDPLPMDISEVYL